MAAVTSAVIAGVGAAMSFKQAYDANQRMKEADRRAVEALKEAREKLSFNAYEGLGINKEAFELQRESINQAIANAMQGAREGTRQGTEGKFLASGQRAHREIASAMTDEKNKLDRLVADQDQANNDELVEIDKAVVEGAQIASENAQRQLNQSIMQGVLGTANAVGLGIDAMPLYRKTALARRAQKMSKDPQAAAVMLKDYGKEGVDLSDVEGMSSEELQQFLLDNFTGDDLKAMRMGRNVYGVDVDMYNNPNVPKDPMTQSYDWDNGNFNLAPPKLP